METQKMKMRRPLLVFDFDHTIADLNTDVEVRKWVLILDGFNIDNNL